MIEMERPGKNPTERIEWAGERYADLCEGEIESEAGWFIWGLLVGWCDVATPDEKRQYEQLAKLFETLLKDD